MSKETKKYAMVGKSSGLIAGGVFAILMAVGGMLPMVAGLVGSTNAWVGLVIHLILSAIVGATYGIIVKEPVGWNFGKHTILGIAYGFIWWILGALIIMPLIVVGQTMLSKAGMEEMIPILVGHIVFGLVFGLVYAKMLFDEWTCCFSQKCETNCDKKEESCTTEVEGKKTCSVGCTKSCCEVKKEEKTKK